MDNSQQIEQYLEALARELGVLGVATPYHFVITGGAYLILAVKRDHFVVF